MSQLQPVLAIDFGTANSVAMLYNGVTIDNITDSSGRFIMPSAVFYAGELPFSVGWDAVALGMTEPLSYKASLKRELGIAGTVPLGGRQFSRVELVAEVLSFLRRNAEDRLGGAIHRAILTVPAAYDEYLCSLMVDAAQLSGLEAVTLSEPAAAAFSEGLAPQDGLLLIYDFGAGTFDAAVVERRGERCTVVGHSGLAHCGGLDVDQIVYQYLASLATEGSQSKVFDGTDVSTLALRRRLRVQEECRQKKELLSTAARVRGDILVLEPPLTYELTRDWLESAMSHLLRRTTDCCLALLSDCQLKPSDLDHVLLVGGSSRMPAVARLVEAELGCESRLARVPETAVAQGAAEWGWTLPTGERPPPPLGTGLVTPPGAGDNEPAQHSGTVPQGPTVTRPEGENGCPGDPVPTPEDSGTCDVVLTAAGPNRIWVVKEVIDLTGLSVWDVKDLVESLPERVLRKVPRRDAVTAAAKLQRAGAEVELREYDLSRYDVILTDLGPQRDAVVGAVHSVTPMVMKRIRILVDQLPAPVLQGVPSEQAQAATAKLRAAGAAVELRKAGTADGRLSAAPDATDPDTRRGTGGGVWETWEATIRKVVASISHGNGVYCDPVIPERKLRNARKHLRVPADEKIIVLDDLTVFGSAKQSVCLGRRGLYYRYLDEACFISRQQLCSEKVSIDGSNHLVIGSKRLFSSANSEYWRVVLGALAAAYRER